MPMPTPCEDCEALVVKEDIWVNRIETCEVTLDAVLEALYKTDSPVHLQTVRDIVSAILETVLKLERELLMVRIEKKLTARHMDRKPPDLH